MRVSGYTFIKNGSRFNYPFIESIRSALPICDEFVVAVGASDDDTRERIMAIGDPKIRIVDTVWNPVLHERGFVLAQQKMIAHYNCTGDWAFYIEGDEVLHEDDRAAVRQSMERHLDNPAVEALWFDYLHFYGDANWLAKAHSFYRREVRIIRNTIRVVTSDSLYFLVLDKKKRGRYPRAASANARMFHYGNARSPLPMFEKRSYMRQLYTASGDTSPPQEQAHSRQEAYRMDKRLLRRFEGTHPAVMADWLAEQEGDAYVPYHDERMNSRDRRNLVSLWIESFLPVDFSKKHFKSV